jgi:signal peptidase I
MRIEDDKYWRTATHQSYITDGDDDPDGALPDDEEQPNGGPRSHVLREVVETIVLTLLIFFVVRAVVQNFRVEGDSMLPTLHSEQYLLVNKGLYFRYDANFVSRLFNPDQKPDMRYLFHGPQRGDIVVFAAPTEPKDFIKRVIATEGETVEIKEDPDPIGDPNHDCGQCGVYVNGVKLKEPYVRATPNYGYPKTTVPPGDVFVLGDNRRNSQDSHIFGPISVDSIIGTAFVSYWPQDRWGLLPHPTYAEMESKNP